MIEPVEDMVYFTTYLYLSTLSPRMFPPAGVFNINLKLYTSIMMHREVLSGFCSPENLH